MLKNLDMMTLAKIAGAVVAVELVGKLTGLYSINVFTGGRDAFVNDTGYAPLWRGYARDAQLSKPTYIGNQKGSFKQNILSFSSGYGGLRLTPLPRDGQGSLPMNVYDGMSISSQKPTSMFGKIINRVLY